MQKLTAQVANAMYLEAISSKAKSCGNEDSHRSDGSDGSMTGVLVDELFKPSARIMFGRDIIRPLKRNLNGMGGRSFNKVRHIAVVTTITTQ